MIVDFDHFKIPRSYNQVDKKYLSKNGNNPEEIQFDDDYVGSKASSTTPKTDNKSIERTIIIEEIDLEADHNETGKPKAGH